MSELDDIDLYRDPAVWADPYPYWDKFREACPVHQEGQYGVWTVTGFDEVMSVYHNQNIWSNCNTVSGPFTPFPVPLEGDDVSDLIEQYRDELPFAGELPTMDGPKHAAHRSLLLRLITPKRLNENEEFMWRAADKQMATFLGQGRVEFIAQFAQPFTAIVVADLEGVPEEDRPRFAEEMTGNRFAPKPKDENGDDLEPEKDPLGYLHHRFYGYMEERRREPRDDVLTGLALAKFPDGTTPELSDIVRIAANLFTAGQETTVRLLSASMQMIANRPDIQQQLRADRSLIPNFVEEMLRFETPIKNQFRLSRVPTELGGVKLPAGTTASIVVGAANRDPKKFECPNEFRVDRPNARQHLAFGHGLHTCVGAPLARAEVKVAIERFFDRMADIRISEEHHGPADARRFEYLPNHKIRGLMELHLEFTPVG